MNPAAAKRYGRLKRLFQNAGLTLLGTLFALAVLEIWASNRAPDFSDLYRSYAHHSRARYRPSKHLGYELIPNSSADINSLGLRSPEYPVAKGEGVFRLMLVGDSLAENYGAALRERFEKSSGPSRKFELWNLGVGSYGAESYAKVLRSKGLRYEPDFVAVFSR